MYKSVTHIFVFLKSKVLSTVMQNCYLNSVKQLSFKKLLFLKSTKQQSIVKLTTDMHIC